jgi:cell division protein FtsX
MANVMRSRGATVEAPTAGEQEEQGMQRDWTTRLYAILRLISTAGVAILYRPKPEGHRGY